MTIRKHEPIVAAPWGTAPDGGHPLLVLGLSRAEQSLYGSLVARGAAVVTLDDIEAEPCVLHRLEALGLVDRVDERDGRWTVAAPEVALDALIDIEQRALRDARQRMAGLAARYRRTAGDTHRPDVATVVPGAEALNAAFEELQHGARREITPNPQRARPHPAGSGPAPHLGERRRWDAPHHRRTPAYRHGLLHRQRQDRRDRRDRRPRTAPHHHPDDPPVGAAPAETGGGVTTGRRRTRRACGPHRRRHRTPRRLAQRDRQRQIPSPKTSFVAAWTADHLNPPDTSPDDRCACRTDMATRIGPGDRARERVVACIPPTSSSPSWPQ
jgi:hypothetical protein